MRYVLVLIALLCSMGCSKGPANVVAAPTPPLTPIATIPVQVEEHDFVRFEDVATVTLEELTEINGQYIPAGTVLKYKNAYDVQATKYLIVVICDYACNQYGPPPPGHDYDPDCTDQSAWVAPRKPGDPTDTDPDHNRYWVLPEGYCYWSADADGSVVRTASIGDPTGDD